MPRKRQTGQGGLYFDATRKLWIGVVDNGYNDLGKRRQVRVTSKSQSIARDKLKKVMDEIEQFGSPLGNQTVAEWGAFWLEGIKAKKPQTYRTYASILRTWVFPVIGRKNVKDVRPSDLKAIYENIKRAGKSESTAVKAHTTMSSMFESARLERITKINVAGDIRPPKASKTKRGTLTPPETVRILEQSRTAPNGSKWWVSLYAGIRQGERIGATIDSIDFENSTFTVQWNLVEGNYEHGCGGACGRKSGHCPQKRLVIPDGMPSRVLRGRYMLVPPKSGEPRTFPLTDKLRDMLQVHIDQLALKPNPHGLLWPNPDGTPTSGRADQAEWRALLIAAGVTRPEATTHWARHTAISDMSAIGISDGVIGEQVGHRSPGVTGGYKHVSSQDAAEAQRKLDERRQLR